MKILIEFNGNVKLSMSEMELSLDDSLRLARVWKAVGNEVFKELEKELPIGAKASNESLNLVAEWKEASTWTKK